MYHILRTSTITAYFNHQRNIFFEQPFSVWGGTKTLLRLYYWLLWERWIHRLFLGTYHSLAMLFDTKHDGSCLGFYFPNHDYDVLALIFHFQKVRDRFFVDVGGNVGSKTLIALKYGYRVAAFEPNPPTADILEINVLLNHFRDRFTLYRSAVAKQIGTATFHVNHTVMSQSSLYKSVCNANYASDLQIRVPVTTLDETLDPHQNITVLKIDAEGAELPVLQGAKKLLENRKIRSIVWEVADDPQAKNILKIQELLSKYGFDHYEYDYLHHNFIPYRGAYNCISLLKKPRATKN